MSGKRRQNEGDRREERRRVTRACLPFRFYPAECRQALSTVAHGSNKNPSWICCVPGSETRQQTAWSFKNNFALANANSNNTRCWEQTLRSTQPAWFGPRLATQQRHHRQLPRKPCIEPSVCTPPHVVVALDGGRRALVADALDHVRVQGALQQEVHLPDALRLLLQETRQQKIKINNVNTAKNRKKKKNTSALDVHNVLIVAWWWLK